MTNSPTVYPPLACPVKRKIRPVDLFSLQMPIFFVTISQQAKEVARLKTQESLENYLETILVLEEQAGRVRAIDIATEMQFSKPSVSLALKKIRSLQLVTVDGEGYIHFTPEGRKTAESVYERHRFLSRFLISLGVCERTAREDACRLEHVLSQESYQKIKEHSEKM